MNGFDRICPGCEYQQMSYEPKADDYGQDPIGYFCNRREYGVDRCPRAAQWRDYFRQRKGEGDGK